MKMPTRTVEITSEVDGQRLKAELLLCPTCDHTKFIIYLPEGVDHVHFQCDRCGDSFCDGCQPPAQPATGVDPDDGVDLAELDRILNPHRKGGAK